MISSSDQMDGVGMKQMKKARRWSENLSCVGNYVSFAVNSLYLPEKIINSTFFNFQKSYDLGYKLLTVQDSEP